MSTGKGPFLTPETPCPAMDPLLCVTADVEPFSYATGGDGMDASIRGLDRLQDLLEAHGVPATLFVSGEFLTPDGTAAVQDLDDEHEIASHGMDHTRMDEMDTDTVREQVRSSHEALAALGHTPEGFRAPMCSWSEELMTVLDEEDYTYDSSLHPTTVPGRYTNHLRSRHPTLHGSVLELPPATSPVLRAPLSWAWLRLFGHRYGQAVLRSCRGLDVIVLYLHPWELVPVSDGPAYARWRTGRSFCRTIDRFLDHATTITEPVTMYDAATAVRHRT